MENEAAWRNIYTRHDGGADEYVVSLGRPRCFTGGPFIRGRLRAPAGAFARTSTFRIGDINSPETASSRFGHGTPHIPEKIVRRQSVLECFLSMKASSVPSAIKSNRDIRTNLQGTLILLEKLKACDKCSSDLSRGSLLVWVTVDRGCSQLNDSVRRPSSPVPWISEAFKTDWGPAWKVEELA